MRNNEAYEKGVAEAKEREEQRQARSEAALGGLVDHVVAKTAKSLAEAKERAEARKAKYGTPNPYANALFIRVPRGVAPFRGYWSDEFAKMRKGVKGEESPPS